MRSGLVVAASALLLVCSFSRVSRADDGAGPAMQIVATGEAREAREARRELEGALAEMRGVSVRVRDQLRLTRKRGTKAQITCVDEALSRADVALRHARGLGDEILGAYARGEEEAARAARGRLAELRTLQRFASVEATKCTPSASLPIQLVLVETTTVTMAVDPRIPRVE
jgi:hypothetical protein